LNEGRDITVFTGKSIRVHPGVDPVEALRTQWGEEVRPPWEMPQTAVGLDVR